LASFSETSFYITVRISSSNNVISSTGDFEAMLRAIAEMKVDPK
jgi:hypothetical protein